MSGSLLRRRHRTPEVAHRLAALEEALAEGGAELDPAAVADAQALLDRAGERLRLGPAHTVVALAGATGSGKSSLFNAVSGVEIVDVGVRRPTTSKPFAAVWGPDDPDPLLDWLEVPSRHRTARETVLDAGSEEPLHGLVLLDLPDHDSTELAHRLEVDRLVEVVDLLVWVVDPEKYADDALHTRYLRRLASHDAVVLVVLNQVDRLDAAGVQSCLRDLRRLLDADGLEGARVLPLSARTGAGVDDLRAALATVVGRRSASTDRLAADVDALVERLRPGVAAVDPDATRLGSADRLVASLASAAGVPAVLDAVDGDYRRRARAATGWPPTRWSRRFRASPLDRLRLGQVVDPDGAGLVRTSLPAPTPAQRARVELAAREVADEASAGLPERWSEAVHRAAAPLHAAGAADLADALDVAVGSVDLEHRRPRWWSLLGGLQVVGLVLLAAGAVGLAALAALTWLGVPSPGWADVAVGRLDLPWPTVALLAGLVLGWVVALVGRRAAAVGGRRRRTRVGRRLEAAVREVARERVLDPVASVVDRHRRTREALDRAA